MPQHRNVYASAIMWSRYDLDLWPLTLKTFSAMPTDTMNICGKFHWNPSTKYRDIMSCEIGVNGQQWTDGWTPENDMPPLPTVSAGIIVDIWVINDILNIKTYANVVCSVTQGDNYARFRSIFARRRLCSLWTCFFHAIYTFTYFLSVSLTFLMYDE